MKNFRFRIQDNNYNVKIVSHENSKIELEVNGTAYSVTMKDEIKKSKTPTLVRSASKNPSVPLKMSSNAGKAKIVAPIPGVVMSIDVKVGDVIKVGDRLLVLEAMKMENEIFAPSDGVVTQIMGTKGATVSTNDIIMMIQ